MNEYDPVIGSFDGLCEWYGGRRNPGGLACGGWIVEPHPAIPAGIVGNAAYCVGEGATNNVAEYRAALSCLAAIWRAGWRGEVILRGDSQIVVYQAEGRYRCNAPPLLPLLERVHRAETEFLTVRFEWIPREENERADAQSREAYERHRRLPDAGLAPMRRLEIVR